MTKLLIRIFFSVTIVNFFGYVYAETPFLERRPFVLPQSGQYPVRSTVDHQFPSTNIEDGTFMRFDGSIYDQNVTFSNACNHGVSCYDGHAGTDYYMPFNTAIVAPANGYVMWASFSNPADPCPGGIDPNGDQGTIIIAHGNSYYSCYFHLNPPLNVTVGQNVETGDTLGYNGNTGCAINAHLHFEIRKDSYFFDTEASWAVDPYGWWGSGPDPITELRGNRSEWLWISTELVDDGDNGFQRNHGSGWSYLSSGYNNDSWIVSAVHEVENSDHYAIWVPWLENAGEYKIEAYIPDGIDAVNAAQYEIIIQNDDGENQKEIINYDQREDTGLFSIITTMHLPQGSKCSVILRDLVDSTTTGSVVVFDAIRFTNTSTTAISGETENSKTWYSASIFAYPNPFNPVTILRYDLPKDALVNITIYDMMGRQIKKLVNSQQTAGYKSVQWNATNDKATPVSAGIYLYTIQAGDFRKTKKLVLLK